MRIEVLSTCMQAIIEIECDTMRPRSGGWQRPDLLSINTMLALSISTGVPSESWSTDTHLSLCIAASTAHGTRTEGMSQRRKSL